MFCLKRGNGISLTQRGARGPTGSLPARLGLLGGRRGLEWPGTGPWPSCCLVSCSLTDVGRPPASPASLGVPPWAPWGRRLSLMIDCPVGNLYLPLLGRPGPCSSTSPPASAPSSRKDVLCASVQNIQEGSMPQSSFFLLF